MEVLFSWLIAILKTISQILMAGVAITAFSMLLYAMTFNLHQKVARAFSLVMVCVVIIYTSESLASTITDPAALSFWLKTQWVGIIFLPPVYLQFSNSILATTGKPSKGKRLVAIIASYIISCGFLVLLITNHFAGSLISDGITLPHLRPQPGAYLFAIFFYISVASSWYNFIRSYLRTTTSSSHRRMGYLLFGSLSPLIGAAPLLLFGSGIIRTFNSVFWAVSAFNYFLVLILLILMAYAVAFFGTGQPDRQIKTRLLEWLMRGPLTASLTLGIITITHRVGVITDNPYPAAIPILVVGSILLIEYLITLVLPVAERYLFWGEERHELQTLQRLKDSFLTQKDIQQFVEMLISAVSDQLQAKGGFITANTNGNMNLLYAFGHKPTKNIEAEMASLLKKDDLTTLSYFKQNDTLYIPLSEIKNQGKTILLGILALDQVVNYPLPKDEQQSFNVLLERIKLVLRETGLQQNIFSAIQEFSTDVEKIRQIRAVGRFGSSQELSRDLPELQPDMIQVVRDALIHYWGGPRLTESPLMQLKIVQLEAAQNSGNYTNAIRSVLKQAVDRIKPEGERHYTTDWILYNILDLKFLEGQKVRDVVKRLAISEADFYRKQRVAIETVAREIQSMEDQIS